MRKSTKQLFIIIALLSGQLIIGTPVFAVTNSTISINLSSQPILNILPGLFSSVNQTVSITTDNYTGYVANITNSSSATDLINTSDNSLIIPTITLPQGSSSITANDFTNGYGISTDATNYVPAPTVGNPISLGGANSSGTNTHTITFGAKVPANTSSGTYERTFVVVAVVNSPQYSVTYEENTGDLVTDMPSDVSTTTSSTGTITLSSDSPTRSGYTFLGWDEDSTVATNPTFAPGDTITLEPTQSNAIILYAIWGSSGGSGTPEDPFIDDTTTAFDPSAQDPDTTVLYEAVSGQPKVTVDGNGHVTSFAFTDTSGVSIDDAATDTGYIPFEGNKSFEIYIKAQFPPSLNNNNGSTSTALGILLDVRNRTTNTGNNMQITYSKNATSPKLIVNSSDNTLGLTTIAGLGNDIFEATITYIPPANSGTGTVTVVYNKNGTMTTKTISRTLSIANQSVFLGYTVNTSGNIIRKAQGTTVYEFYIKDL